jgi:hypothetical protein
MERDVGIGVEMIALFVRFWLSNTPPPPESERAAMRRRGGARYAAVMEALGRRLAKGPKVRQEIGEDFPHQEERADYASSCISTPDYDDHIYLLKHGIFCLS